MSEEQIRDLVRLDPSRFERREYAALAWVRSFLNDPQGVPVDIQEEFELVFEPGERTNIQAAMKGMFCANLFMNTCRHLLGRLQGTPAEDRVVACPIEPPV